MNGVHDMGGMDGFGKVEAEQNEPPFHADVGRPRARHAARRWATPAPGTSTIRAMPRRRLPPRDLSRRLLLSALGAGMEKNLLERGFWPRTSSRPAIRCGRASRCARKLTKDVVDAGMTRNSFFRQQQGPARFKPGDRVRTVNINPLTHTRLPRYARDKVGMVELIHGCHAFPDSVASERGDDPQWLYTVVFDGREIWGPDADPTLDDLDRRLRALSRTGMTDRPTIPVAGIPSDAEGPGVPRALGGAGLRHGAGVAQARPVHLAGMGGHACRRDQAGAGGGRSRHRRDLLLALAQCPRATGHREGHRRRRAPGALSRRLGPRRRPHAGTAIRSSSGRKISRRGVSTLRS